MMRPPNGSVPADSVRSVSIELLGMADVLARSRGEVVSDRFYLRNRRPDPAGLLSSKIFGCQQDYTCDCGRHRRMPPKAAEFACPACGIPLTPSDERRRRFGHIRLPLAAVHPWMLFRDPYVIADLLGITAETAQFAAYGRVVLTLTGNTLLPKGQLVDSQVYSSVASRLVREAALAKKCAPFLFNFLTGGELLHHLLKAVDAEKTLARVEAAMDLGDLERRRAFLASSHPYLRDPYGVKFNAHLEKLAGEKNWAAYESERARTLPLALEPTDANLERRRRSILYFLGAKLKAEDLVLRALPVLPPDLRPVIRRENGEVLASDLNLLYQEVLKAGRRAELYLEDQSVSLRLRAAYQLQRAVTSLMHNGADGLPAGQRGLEFKGLANRLEGKLGRFRRNLYGKRVDFSGRSVIVTSPRLGMDECGLPLEMARELFSPFTIRELVLAGTAKSDRHAMRLIARDHPSALEALENVMATRFVLLNRAPSLHRHSVQGFRPRLMPDARAIRLNPLVVAGFNADFDGDQMAVHVPLSVQANEEVGKTMLPSANLVAGATGAPQHNISQEAVLGLYYLTVDRAKGRGDSPAPAIGTEEELLLAMELGELKRHDRISYRWRGARHATTAGRALFHQIVPEGIPFTNAPLSKKVITGLISRVIQVCGAKAASRFLVSLRDLGFAEATRAGLSFGTRDLVVPPKKTAVVTEALEEAARADRDFAQGVISDEERYRAKIAAYAKAVEESTDLAEQAVAADQDGFNNFHLQLASGARGSRAQLQQLTAMRGVMTKIGAHDSSRPFVETPIWSNLKEGYSAIEMSLAARGGRKSFADVSLGTAPAGYLTRRLVDAGHHFQITDHDCGDTEGIEALPLVADDGTLLAPLAERLAGRVLARGTCLEGETFKPAQPLTAAEAECIAGARISVRIRSPLTCRRAQGCCQLCYGQALHLDGLPLLGALVGVWAGQSVGETGTQLTLRSKHTSGVAVIESDYLTVKAPWSGEASSEGNATGEGVLLGPAGAVLLTSGSGIYRIPLPAGARVHAGPKVAGEPLATLPVDRLLLAPDDGVIELTVEKRVVSEAPHLVSVGKRSYLVLKADAGEMEIALWPGLLLTATSGRVQKGAILGVEKGTGHLAGRDITEGLPKVVALLEKAVPADAAHYAPVAGRLAYGPLKRGFRELNIHLAGSKSVALQVPYAARLLVASGAQVSKGQQLTAGAPNISNLEKAVGAVTASASLASEVLAEYRRQGVQVNPIHFETVAAALGRYIRSAGEAGQIARGEVVPLHVAEQLGIQGKRVLVRLKSAGLLQGSWMAAASYQSSARVLYQSSIKGLTDPIQHPKAKVILGQRLKEPRA